MKLYNTCKFIRMVKYLIITSPTKWYVTGTVFYIIGSDSFLSVLAKSELSVLSLSEYAVLVTTTPAP